MQLIHRASLFPKPHNIGIAYSVRRMKKTLALVLCFLSGCQSLDDVPVEHRTAYCWAGEIRVCDFHFEKRCYCAAIAS